jgi:hypothetical protein
MPVRCTPVSAIVRLHDRIRRRTNARGTPQMSAMAIKAIRRTEPNASSAHAALRASVSCTIARVSRKAPGHMQARW